jgi:hypothetical protein
MGRLMAGIGDIVVTAHTDDYDDDDGMVPAPVDGLPTAPGDGHATAPVDGHATASGGASPPVEDAFEDAFEDPFEGVDPAALAEMEAAAVKAAAVDEDDNVTNAYIANDPRAQGELRSAGGLEEEALVQAVQQTARGCTGRASQYVRGLWAEAGELRSGRGREEEALVQAVQQTARGCICIHSKVQVVLSHPNTTPHGMPFRTPHPTHQFIRNHTPRGTAL